VSPYHFALATDPHQGTIVPLGWAVADALTQAHVTKPFDAVVLSGDISYATLSPPKNEMEWVWCVLAVKCFVCLIILCRLPLLASKLF
jgi:hypothetical protein